MKNETDNNRPIKVYLFGSEENDWALDTDFTLTRRSLLNLGNLIQLSSLEDADVVHSVWEEPLLNLNPSKLEGKRIVCHVCNDFMRLHENPCMIRSQNTVGLWVAMSREAETSLQTLGYPYVHIPYSVDTDIFQPLDHRKLTKAEVRNRYRIPPDIFLISNFMRDSLGHNLATPKDQKGSELLLEVGIKLQERGVPVHFLLAGPRRHWIRKQLDTWSVPFTFIGHQMKRDDHDVNITSADIISDLYGASDLHLITSRWEGGPRSVLEAAATRTPVLSTKVGIAPDILSDESLYASVDEAIIKAEKHFHQRLLDETLEKQYRVIYEKHTPESNAPLFQKLYRGLDAYKTYTISSRWQVKPTARVRLRNRLKDKLRSVLRSSDEKTNLRISLWHEFHKPPYGGGNQFMMALKGAMEQRGVEVVNNELSRAIDIHICNSCWFDFEKFRNKAVHYPVKMIHRIDGPVTLYRGEGRVEDEKIFDINRKFASATVFQSAYSFRKSYELGFRAVSPVVIHNGVNGEIFHEMGKKNHNKKEKIRLISSAWSDNPRKGGPFLKWLDEHLDWSRYEYTFVGRVNEEFNNIIHIPPVPSEELADLLRQHDMYVSVSLHEPCSNALLEALSCGLPALYRNDGGSPELVSFGGLAFEDENDVLDKLDRLAGNLNSFQRVLRITRIDEVASRYIALAEQIIKWDNTEVEMDT